MEPKIVKEVLDKCHESIKETQTLYDLGEAETVLLTNLIFIVSANTPVSNKLLARLLRAASHLIERNDDIAKEIYEKLKDSK